MLRVSENLLSRNLKRLQETPVRRLNEARFTTIDRKNCSFNWTSGSQVDITLQDRTNSITFPMNLRRNAGKLLSCMREGGIVSLSDSKYPEVELKVGSDKGVIYFALKNESTSISTGLAPGEAAILNSLIQFSEKRRISRLM